MPTPAELNQMYEALVAAVDDYSRRKRQAAEALASAKMARAHAKLNLTTKRAEIDLLIREQASGIGKKAPSVREIEARVQTHPEVRASEQAFVNSEAAVAMADAEVMALRAEANVLDTRREHLMMLSAISRDEMKITRLTT